MLCTQTACNRLVLHAIVLLRQLLRLRTARLRRLLGNGRTTTVRQCRGQCGDARRKVEGRCGKRPGWVGAYPRLEELGKNLTSRPSFAPWLQNLLRDWSPDPPLRKRGEGGGGLRA